MNPSIIARPVRGKSGMLPSPPESIASASASARLFSREQKPSTLIDDRRASAGPAARYGRPIPIFSSRPIFSIVTGMSMRENLSMPPHNMSISLPSSGPRRSISRRNREGSVYTVKVSPVARRTRMYWSHSTKRLPCTACSSRHIWCMFALGLEPISQWMQPSKVYPPLLQAVHTPPATVCISWISV